MTIGGSLRRLERYFQIVAESVSYHLTVSDGVAFLEQRLQSPPHPAIVLTREGGLGVIWRVVNSYAERPMPLSAVSFQHDAPADTSLLETFFNCPVAFNCERTGFEFDADWLSTPNRLGDTALSAYFQTRLDDEIAARQPASVTLAGQTKEAIAEALSEGVPPMGDIASKLGMSARSFARRLSDDGMSFKTITESTRRELAEQLLQEPQHSLAEVAFLTGFSEQSSFTRAFKRWFGATPAQFRKRQHRP